MENCIYRFLNVFGRVIYIGKAKCLKQRLGNHNHLPNVCYEETASIEYCTFESEYDMDFAERYFIPKYNPKYNTVLAGKEITIQIDEFDSKQWFVYSKENEVSSTKSNNNMIANKAISEEDVVAKKVEVAKQMFFEKLNKTVVVILTGEVFNTMYDASVEFGIDVGAIMDSCDGIYGVIEKTHPIYGCHISFRYKEEYNRENMIGAIEKYTRSVICLTTNEVFPNVGKAQEKYQLANIRGCCRGAAYYCGSNGEDPFVWMWKDKYETVGKEYINNKLTKAYEIYTRKTKKKVA